MSKALLERKCHEDRDRIRHGCGISDGRRRFRHNRSSDWDANRIPACRRHVPRGAHWSTERRLRYPRVLAERKRERRKRAVSPQKTACLEGYKASASAFLRAVFFA